MAAPIAVGVHEYATGRPGKFDPAENKARFPGITLTRPFISHPLGAKDDLGALFIAAATPSWDAGLEPQVSFKLMPQEVIRGTWTGRIREGLARAREASRGRPTTAIYWHEGSKEVYRADGEGLYTAAQYADAWQIVYDNAKAVWPELTVAYCETSFVWRPGDARTRDTAPYRGIPADLWLDDVYAGNTWSATMLISQHPGHNRWNEVLAAGRNKRWGLGEFGRSDTGSTVMSRPALFRDDLSYLLTTACERITFWCTPGQERSVLWPWDVETARVVRDELIPLMITPPVLDGPYPAPDGFAWSQTVPGALVSEASGVLFDPQHLPDEPATVRAARL